MKLHVSKVLTIFIIMIYVISIVTNLSFAAFDVSGKFGGEIDGNATETATKVEQVLSAALEAVRIAGIAIAIIILIVIGIKIMMAAPSERANVKQYAMNYVIGAFIMIGAVGILTIVKEVADSAFGNK